MSFAHDGFVLRVQRETPRRRQLRREAWWLVGAWAIAMIGWCIIVLLHDSSAKVSFG
ncbi:hypothetical protein HED60_10260 [Planctomycetales bacterium ZRK34]|nr:hypothetical protein HED60_10260 [Planctomycetales bacterium ZRK34]